MAKPKQNARAKSLKHFFSYLTAVSATLFGAYWVTMGITNANPSWEEPVSNLILIVLILSAIAGGFVFSMQSIRKKREDVSFAIAKNVILPGVVHDGPTDLHKAILSEKSVTERWADLTPLARNEWICWVVTVKKPETRANHINRMRTELLAGKRRPCCWAGCAHRNRHK